MGKSSEQVGVYYETTNYDRFKTIEGNRDVNLRNVKRIIGNIEKVGALKVPILVNENYEIIDGQHRFEAFKRKNLPITYMIQKGYGLKEVQALNSNTSNWNNFDYLKSYCESGYGEYEKLEQFMRDYPDFGIQSAERICSLRQTNASASKSPNAANKFRLGEFVCPDIRKSYEIANKLMMIKPYYKNFHRGTFVSTMMGLFNRDNYDHKYFIGRLKRHSLVIEDQPSVKRWIDHIEEVYNYRNRDKQSFRY
jgi:hypothetical protein